MTEVLKVIEKLTSSSDLTKAANFGLQDWSSSAIQRVPISINGAATINLNVTPKITVNGVEKTNPDYKASWWIPVEELIWTVLCRKLSLTSMAVNLQ